jgi:hypothetical protein
MAASTLVVSPSGERTSSSPTLFYQPQYLICSYLSIAQYIHNHDNLLTIFARHTVLHVITSLVRVPARPRAYRRRACFSPLELSTPVDTKSSLPVYHVNTRSATTVTMDTDMTDVAYDIDIDDGAGLEPAAQQPQQQVIEVSSTQGYTSFGAID